MFSFFQRKKYLVDLLEGFVDIHNHILPGIDDGAKSIEETKELLSQFSDIGISNFIATPHIMNDYYGNDKKTIANANDLLQEGLKNIPRFNHIKIRYAAEYMIDANYEQLLKNKELLTLKSDYILFEMSYYQAPLNLDEVIFKTFSKGFVPILAHPERYSFFHSKFYKYEELKNQQIPFQLNALALSDHYGSSIQKTAYKLLEKDMYNFLATDTHHLQHIEKLKEVKIKEKYMSQIISLIDQTKATFYN